MDESIADLRHWNKMTLLIVRFALVPLAMNGGGARRIHGRSCRKGPGWSDRNIKLRLRSSRSWRHGVMDFGSFRLHSQRLVSGVLLRMPAVNVVEICLKMFVKLLFVFLRQWSE